MLTASYSQFMAATISLPTNFPYLTTNPSLSPQSIHYRVFSCSALDQANDQNTDLRIVFAAGGTGGHIYPAVAIADELKINNPNIKTFFAGTLTGMESTAIPSAGYDFEPISAVQLSLPILSPQNLLLPYRLINAIIQSYHLLIRLRPHIVVGTGGYVSFPICLTAAIIGIKVVIQEQNSVPGIANWLLSFVAQRVFLAFNSSIDCFPKNAKCVVRGNPVRSSLCRNVSKEVGRLHYFPKSAKKWDSEAKLVLVLGGSLGANAVNIALLNVYYQMLLDQKKLFIIWQTGVEAFNEMESLVKIHPRLLLKPFLHSMDLAYAAADLIVSRAGAMTCSEILATGKPAILIPSPNVAEGHQFKNASLMADLAGSRVITEDELDSTTLGIAIEEVLDDASAMANMSERALQAAKPNAAAEIAECILSLINMPTTKEK